MFASRGEEEGQHCTLELHGQLGELDVPDKEYMEAFSRGSVLEMRSFLRMKEA